MFDSIVRNGRIVDGTGRPSFRGEIAIQDGRIAALARSEEDSLGEARRFIDAGGQVVAPGFIDPHTHYDAQLTWDGMARPAPEHGVTTVIPGNCSLSLAPLKAEHRDFLAATFRQIEEMPQSAFDAGLRWNWETMAEYIATISPDLGINVAPMVGHSPLRLWVLGLESRERSSTPAEVRAIADLLRECLDAGALGMSTSFVDIDHEYRPVPCRLGTPEELDALCAVLGERNRPLQLLPEFYEPDLICARIDIMGELSIRHGIPISFSPIFESHTMPGLVDTTLERLELQAARGARLKAQMQTRPIDFTFDMSQINALFSTMPAWVEIMLAGQETMRSAFLDEARRATLVAATENAPMPIALEFHVPNLILSAASGASRGDVGRTLGEIAKDRGQHAVEVLMDVTLEEDFKARFTATSLGHYDAKKIGSVLRHPNIQIGGGDGGAHVQRFATYGDTCYLFSKFVREVGSLSLEDAVRGITSDIAEFWGLEGRGQLAVGQTADIVVFDPDTIDRGVEELAFDLPDEGQSYRFVRHAQGVTDVLVAGESIYRADSGYQEASPGAVVRGISQ